MVGVGAQEFDVAHPVAPYPVASRFVRDRLGRNDREIILPQIEHDHLDRSPSRTLSHVAIRSPHITLLRTRRVAEYVEG